MAKFLEFILTFCEMWQIEDSNLKALMSSLRIRSRDANQYLHNNVGCLMPDYAHDPVVHKKLQCIKMEIRQVYDILADPWRSTVVITEKADYVMKFLESLLENDQHLLNSQVCSTLPLKNEYDSVDKNLRFLRNFLGFISKRNGTKLEKMKHLLVTHVGVAAFKISCLLFLCSANEMDGFDENDMKIKLKDQLQKIKPIELETREIYIKILKAVSDSGRPDPPILNKFDLGFLDFLLENIIELSEIKLGVIKSFMDQILALHQELSFLKIIVLDKKFHPRRHFNFLIAESGCVIFSLYGADKNQDMARDLKDALPNLLAKFGEVKMYGYRIYDSRIGEKKLWLDSLIRDDFLVLLTTQESSNGQTLGLMAGFLKSILNCSGKWQIGNGNLKALLTRVQLRYQDAIIGLHLHLPDNKENGISLVLKNLELIKPDLREVYNMISDPKESMFVSIEEADHVIEFLESLMKNTKDILKSKAYSVLPVKNELEIFDKILRLCRCFLGFALKTGDTELDQKQKVLLTYVETAAFNITCLLYLCSSNNMKELKAQLQKIRPIQPVTRGIYIKLLKAVSDSGQPDLPMFDNFALVLLDFLLENIIELSEIKPHVIKSFIDQILALHQELCFLKIIVLDKKFNHLSNHPNILIIESVCVILSLYDADNNEDMARVLKDALSSLLAKFGDVKAYGNKVYDPQRKVNNLWLDSLIRYDFLVLLTPEESSNDQTLGMAGFLKAILNSSGKSQIENGNRKALLAPQESSNSQILGLMAGFLKSILNCSEKWKFEKGNLKALLARVQLRYQDAILDLHLHWPDNKENGISLVLKKLELIKPDLREVYNMISDPKGSMYSSTEAGHVIEFLESLVKSIKDILNSKAYSIFPAKNELETFDKLLRFWRCFLGFTLKTGNTELDPKQKVLLTYVETAAFNMTCLLYLCSSNNMKELKAQLQKISPVQPETREIYIELLKAVSDSGQPDSPMVEEFSLLFLDFLLNNMMELSERNLGFITSFKDEILDLHHEVELLKLFLHQQKLLDLCKPAKSLITETGCVIFLLYVADNNKNMARNLKDALSNLPAKFREAKAEIYVKEKTLNLDCVCMHKFLLSLRRLNNLENAQTLRLMIGFMMSILSFSAKLQIENGDHKALLTRVRIRYFDAIEAVRGFWADSEESGIPEDLNGWTSLVLKKLALIKPELREVYKILGDPSISMVLAMDEANIIEFLESLLMNTKDLFDSVLPVKNELKSFDKSLNVLRCFLHFTATKGRRRVEEHQLQNESNRRLLLSHVISVALSIVCLLFLCLDTNNTDGHDEDDIKLELQAQLQKIKPVQGKTREIYIKALKAKSHSSSQLELDIPMVDEFALGFLNSIFENMIELSERNLGFITSVKNELSALHSELAWLQNYTMDPRWKHSNYIVNDQQLNDLCKNFNSLITETGYVIFLLYDADENGEIGMDFKAALADLLNKVEDAIADAREKYDTLVPKRLRSDFPQTNFQGFISSLLQNLNDVVKDSRADTGISLVKHDIVELEKELLCLRHDFSEITKIPREFELLNHQWTRFNDVTYQAEYVIDLFLATGCPLLHFRFGISDVIKEIKKIRTELQIVQSKLKNDHPSGQEVANFSNHDPLLNDLSLSSSDYATDETDGMTNASLELVAFDDGTERILDQLTSDEKELQIVSIVGMPGIGKTTLADSLYDHPSVASFFHVRARVRVSKSYQRRKLLVDILQGLIGGTENLYEECDEHVIEEELYKSLKGQRYLIFMDDLWDIRPWLDIKACFNNDKKGSRIIFTSRSLNIASQANVKSTSYHLDLLSDKKSWDMLFSKLFKKDESCPAELEPFGKEIAKGCKGLPLTIDLIAGVLRTKERTKYCWQQIAKSVMTQISEDPQQRCQKVLEHSYNNLPDHLRPCLLYFGAFPEDAEVEAKRLIWLWIAEGFVQLDNVDESIEKTAEAYLNHLIARSLVIISKKRSLGGVKASHIHDLLHDFARRKAEEEFFLLQIKGQCNQSSTSLFDYRNEGYRMYCNSSNWSHFVGSRPFCSRVRSILLYISHLPNYQRAVLTFSFCGFRLVRVLDLQDIDKINYDPTISLMVHLKFISLSAMQDWILGLLPKFQNLETILLVGQRLRIFSVDNIWNLLRLRHFRVGYCVLKLAKRNVLMKSFQFHNLLSLSNISLRCNEETENMMRRLPNLQRLSCTVYDSWDYKKKINLFPNMCFLEKLYSLKMVYVGKVLYPVSDFSFPQYLKRLTLSEFQLPWCEISKIAKLKHLEVLKLRIRAFEGDVWHMRNGEFLKLRVLSLCKLDIEEWNTDEMEDELPPLEHLEILDCKNLGELPFCLANIPTLKTIRLWQCNSFVEISAGKIVEEQKANENEEIEILRYPPTKTGWRDRMEFLSLSS
ncbi:hypothetical protein M9H77_09112 [Catharanthus roseus]|uniref:Uncharacterized protein n=1 Tax=Catharanthus roseus TaxID=4058 RepID=A0ACC0BZZ8_CATRO|nr:hypothetical protein M9H77_09112 [Catharanthus roseus]